LQKTGVGASTALTKGEITVLCPHCNEVAENRFNRRLFLKPAENHEGLLLDSVCKCEGWQKSNTLASMKNSHINSNS